VLAARFGVQSARSCAGSARVRLLASAMQADGDMI